MYVFVMLKRSRNVNDDDRNNFVNTVKALVDVLGIVSRLFHSLLCNYLCSVVY